MSCNDCWSSFFYTPECRARSLKLSSSTRIQWCLLSYQDWQEWLIRVQRQANVTHLLGVQVWMHVELGVGLAAQRAYNTRFSGHKARGRPRKTWINGVKETLSLYNIPPAQAFWHAADKRLFLPATPQLEDKSKSKQVWMGEWGGAGRFVGGGGGGGVFVLFWLCLK